MHVAVSEFARNVAGLEGANSTEMDPETPYPVIDLLPEQKEIEELGGTMRLGAQAVELAEGTRAREIYDQPESTAPLEITVTAMKARWKGDAPYPVGRPGCPSLVESPVRLRWREEPGARPRGFARALTLDLRRLPRGRYVVAIQVSVAGQPRGCSTRELRVAAR